jgi:uncharacterized protein YjbI with pentapeptide repeats
MDHFDKLSQGAGHWNAWREKNPTIKPDLTGRTINPSLDLTKVNLRGAKIIGVDFSSARLSFADFSDASISRCRFDQADLSGARFLRTDCARTSFRNSNVAKCLFSGSMFSNCVFNRATGEGIRIVPCSERSGFLPQPDFFASGRSAEFHNCDFSGAGFPDILAQARIGKCKFCHARLSAAGFRKSEIKGCDFSSAHLERADFSETTTSETNFRQAALSKAGFRKASLHNVDLRGACCDVNTDFALARFTKVRMEHADLARAELQTRLKPAQVQGLIVGSDLVYLKRSFTGFKRWLHVGALFVFVAPYAIHLIRIEVGHEVIEQTLDISNYLASAVDRATPSAISGVSMEAPGAPETQIEESAKIAARALKQNVSQYLTRDLQTGKIPYKPLYRHMWDYIQHHDPRPGQPPDWLDRASYYFFYFLLAYNIVRIVILFKTSQLEHEEEVLNLKAEFSFRDYPGWGFLYRVMAGLTLPYYVVVILHTYEYSRADRYFLS